MKRIISTLASVLALSALMAFTFASCSGEPTAEETPETVEPGEYVYYGCLVTGGCLPEIMVEQMEDYELDSETDLFNTAVSKETAVSIDLVDSELDKIAIPVYWCQHSTSSFSFWAISLSSDENSICYLEYTEDQEKTYTVYSEYYNVDSGKVYFTKENKTFDQFGEYYTLVGPYNNKGKLYFKLVDLN